jgi:hypothetical protein
MAANIQTFTKTITIVRTVEAVSVDDTTTADINEFLAGSGFHYYTQDDDGACYRIGVAGYMTRKGAKLTVRDGQFIVKVNGEVTEVLSADMLAQRYGN